MFADNRKATVTPIRRPLLPTWLILVFAALLLGCSSAEPAGEVDPTPTATPAPTNTPAPTHTPEPSPTAAAAGSCDITPLNEALVGMGTMDSFRVESEIEIDFEDEALLTMAIEMGAAYEDGDLAAFYTFFRYTGMLEEEARIILDGEEVYLYTASTDSWQVLDADLVLGSDYEAYLESSQFVNPNLVAALEGRPCEVTTADYEDQGADVYRFTDVDIGSVPFPGEEMSLGELLGEVQPGEVEIWLASVAGQSIPVRTEMTTMASDQGQELSLRVVQTLEDINRPLEVELPDFSEIDVERPGSFFLDVPLPEDAVFSLNSEEGIIYTTGLSKAEVAELYGSYFEENGWVVSTTFTNENSGLPTDFTEYARDDRQVAVGLAADSGVTFVLISNIEE